MRDQIVAEARTWLGTPFRHQGRVKGVGVDCVGLAIGVASALGLADYKEIAYSRQPDPDVMKNQLDAYLKPIDRSEVLPGDLYWIRFIHPMHIAIATRVNGKDYMIHSYYNAKKCVEHRLNGEWKNRIVACYRFRGLD
jgi:NlpC/P60 family putative phage cell wall peptidase